MEIGCQPIAEEEKGEEEGEPMATQSASNEGSTNYNICIIS